MGALASSHAESRQQTARTRPPRGATSRPARFAAGREGPRTESWNVLAEELLPFPPVSIPVAERRAAVRSATRRHPSAPAGLHRPEPAGTVAPESGRRAPVVVLPVRRHAPSEPAGRARPYRVPDRPRGLRRLLPGVATLAVLGGVWLGAGALSSLHHTGLGVLASSTKVPGGYAYVARPGDTLWSIATRLEPTGDPRPIVAGLEQQLHGATLRPGDRLRLP